MRNGWLFVLAAGLTIAVAVQFSAIHSLKTEVVELRALLGSTQSTSTATLTASVPKPVTLGNIPGRVTDLESAVADLNRNSEFMMQRGLVPPNAQKLQQLQALFADPNARDTERLQAFRLLRRNGIATDELASQAIAWLQYATNGNVRRDLLRNMDGLTNASMKEPLLAMLGSEANSNLRRSLIDVLADFSSSDPSVESKIWELALKDPDEGVREEAQEALVDGRKTPERLAALVERARDTTQPIDSRILALRGLRENNNVSPEVIADLAAVAQNSTDPQIRTKIFDAFDGMSDPNMMVPLVYGLQDQDAGVRQRAADALSAFSADPRIHQWLTHLVQNDADPRVRREAQQALEEAQRRNNRRNRD